MIDIDLIERFIDGDLSEKEQAEFEQRLANDSDLKILYRFRIKVADKWKEAKEFEETKNRIGQIINRERKRYPRIGILYRVAAVLIILITIPALLILDRKEANDNIVDSGEIKIHKMTPDEKASVNYFDEKFQLFFPGNGEIIGDEQNIIFRWESSLDVKTAILIKTADADSLVRRIEITSNIREYEAKINLKKGAYTWQLEGFEGTMRFLIK